MPVLQGPSEVFRIVNDRACIKHETLPRNRFLLHQEAPALTLGLYSLVGSNTETDDDCRPATFHRGAFGVKTPFSIQTYHPMSNSKPSELRI
jgi:hypothetical protein